MQRLVLYSNSSLCCLQCTLLASVYKICTIAIVVAAFAPFSHFLVRHHCVYACETQDKDIQIKSQGRNHSKKLLPLVGLEPMIFSILS